VSIPQRISLLLRKAQPESKYNIFRVEFAYLEQLINRARVSRWLSTMNYAPLDICRYADYAHPFCSVIIKLPVRILFSFAVIAKENASTYLFLTPLQTKLHYNNIAPGSLDFRAQSSPLLWRQALRRCGIFWLNLILDTGVVMTRNRSSNPLNVGKNCLSLE
jgi:hypothetical protein